MRRRVLGLAACPVALGLLLLILLSSAKTPAQRVTSPAEAKPNLNGIWQALNTANWDIQTHGPSAGPSALGAIGAIPPGIGIVEGGYTVLACGCRDQERKFRKSLGG